MSVCVAVNTNSHACYIWIVNDLTDSNTCFLFYFFAFILFRNSMCKEVCVCLCQCVCVCIAVSSPAWYI